MLKEFVTKKLLKAKMKGVPQEQQDMIFSALEKNPQLFEKIAKETKQLQKKGKSEMLASMEVMRKYQGELQKLMMK